MKKTENQQTTFTRAEIVRAISGVYRAEQAEYHRLVEQVKQAAADGEAALYVMCSQSAEKQDCVLKTVRYVADVLGIHADELNAAANQNQEGA